MVFRKIVRVVRERLKLLKSIIYQPPPENGFKYYQYENRIIWLELLQALPRVSSSYSFFDFFIYREENGVYTNIYLDVPRFWRHNWIFYGYFHIAVSNTLQSVPTSSVFLFLEFRGKTGLQSTTFLRTTSNKWKYTQGDSVTSFKLKLHTTHYTSSKFLTQTWKQTRLLWLMQYDTVNQSI